VLGLGWSVKSVQLFIKHSPQFPLKPLISLMRFFDFMKNNHIFHTPGLGCFVIFIHGC